VSRPTVLVSGGVDSSVALAELVAAGARPQAAYLKIWLEDDTVFGPGCPWEEDLHYVQATCELLGVPLTVVPLQQAYRERIVAYTLAELRAGHTPSPDLLCNREIKLGAFLEVFEAARGVVATGHYARRTESASGESELRRAVDPVKDQTYFLSRLTPSQLERVRFPLGALPKAAVRARARELGLPAAARPDSQGLCFLGRVHWNDFVRAHLGERPGAIVDEDGRELGRHRGHWFVTLGQRHGLGLSGGPYFVVAKDPARDLVVVRHASDPRPLSSTIDLSDPHWLATVPEPGEQLRVKLRHGPQLAAATYRDGAITLEAPDRGAAPGQFAVFYRDDLCVGSAVVVGRR
jgi:tRNA-specific 2-thiouridylase